MKYYKHREMKYGYMVGDFSPAALKSKDVEIAIKKMKKGTLDAAYYRKTDQEMIYLISGKLEVDSKVYKKGDILVYEPYEMINLFALADSELMIVKFPGTKKDLFRREWKNYEEMDSFYGYYLGRLSDMSAEQVSNMESRIEPKDISVVIQGYADRKITPYTISSIRKYLPGAKIILSTWRDCDCEDFDYDELILNDDPGACECSRWEEMKISNNGNRQIVSTKNGLAHVKTRYALKLRSDLLLLGNDFLKYLYNYPASMERYKLFDNRIIIGEMYTRNYFIYCREEKKYEVPKPFHPSDWFAFGLTKDLNKLYSNVDLIPMEEMKDFQCKYPERVVKNNYKYSWRYTTEQHIFLGIVKNKFPDLQFEDWTDWSEENIELSRKLIMNNFIILNFYQHKILNMKYSVQSFFNNGIRYAQKKLIYNKEFREFYSAIQEGCIE